MNHDLSRQLLAALAKIDRPGTFAAQGSVPLVLPGLEVAGLGAIGLPLAPAQAQAMKAHCEQAPFGKGEQTLVDTTVRRVWRLSPERFALSNPEWGPLVGGIVEQVREELGLEKQKLESHLHELLLYEAGSFFLPHRDGEKLDRMVATLVVVLPSEHQGGELVVRHDGAERVIDFSTTAANRFQVHFAAFYADCEHEVRPLREGHRLCLVYNLTLGTGRKGLTAPRSGEQLERVRALLRRWADEDDSGNKLVITLDHQYTEDGLAWDKLKGADRAKAQVLVEAAEQAGCRGHLALLTLHESGSAEYTGRGRGSRSWRRRGGWYDDESDDPSDYEMGEVFEASLVAEQWTARDGKRLEMGALSVGEEELLDPEALRKIEPKEVFEGYTGNAGMTLDRWYRHAAVVLWPEKAHFRVLCDGFGQRAIPMLQEAVREWKRASGPEAVRLKGPCLGLASAILAEWHVSPYGHGFSTFSTESSDKFLTLLESLGDEGLLRRFLGDVAVRDASVELSKGLAKLGAAHGWGTFQPELETLFNASEPQPLDRNLGALEALCLACPRQQDEWLALCQSLSRRIVAALEAADGAAAQADPWARRSIQREQHLLRLARALLATDQEPLLARVVHHALATPELYPLAGAMLTALLELGPWLKKHLDRPSPAVARWAAACRQQLVAQTPEEPQPYKDLARPADFSCRCDECGQLKRFLKDATAPEHRFAVREERRQHLVGMIQQHHLDLDHRVEQRSRPYTLVCTKNEASYRARLKKYHEDVESLAQVRGVEATLPR